MDELKNAYEFYLKVLNDTESSQTAKTMAYKDAIDWILLALSELFASQQSHSVSRDDE